MANRVHNNIKAYDMGDNWYTDIVDSGTDFTAYIYYGTHGRKMFMYSMPKDQPNGNNITLTKFKGYVENVWEDYTESYMEEEECLDNFWEEYDYGDNESEADEDCENCPHHDDDCDCCTHCQDADEDDGITYNEDGEAVATICMAKLIGTDEEVEKADKIRLEYLDWLHDNFKTDNHYSLLLFARWTAQRFKMASFWISIEDYTDMMHTAVMMHIWMTETADKGEAA